MAKILGNTNTLTNRLDCLWRFVEERERIRVQKEMGKPRPWTTDAILHKYHFCNVCREDDRVTKWIGTWAMTAPQDKRWFWFAVARWINEPDTLKDLPPPDVSWRPALVKKVLGLKVDRKTKVFRAAYIINGYPGMPKYMSVVDKVLTPLWNNPPDIKRDSIELSWKALREYPGMGSFMAGQIVADWQTFGVIRGMDVDTWAPLGPGSERGLQWVFNTDKKHNQDESVNRMRLCREHLDNRNAALTSRLSLHDVQNCLCEFSKYVRGYSKTQYVPYQENLL